MLAAGVGRVPALRRRRTFCMLAGVRCISHQIRYWVFCFCGNCSSMRVLRYEVLCCSILRWIGQIIIVSSYLLGRVGYQPVSSACVCLYLECGVWIFVVDVEVSFAVSIPNPLLSHCFNSIWTTFPWFCEFLPYKMQSMRFMLYGTRYWMSHMYQ